MASTPARATIGSTWGLGDVAIAFAAWFAASVLVAAIDSALPATATGRGISVVLGIALPWVPLIGWPWWAARSRGAGPGADLGWQIKRSDIPIGLLGGFVSLGLGAAVGALTTRLFGGFNSAAGTLAQTLHGQRFWLVLFAALVAFGAPLVEECAFRGLLFAALLKRGLSPRVTVVLVALAFSCSHFEPIRIPLLFAVGLVLGYLRERTGRVGASVIAHSVNNALGAWSLLWL